MKSHASMNRIYRLVWNETLNLWVAVAENAKGRGKGGRAASALALDMLPGQGARAGQTGDPAGFTLKSACRAALVLLAAIGLGLPLAYAGPEGGTVVGGTASITQSGANTTINQSSQRTAIDWNSFSTAAHESIVFNQPNAQAVALNRITGSSPSELLGSLTANGQVFILNPNGVLFGAGAQVNVGGLVASTLSMSNADFMAGNHVFSKVSGSGRASVVNQGSLNAAPGGYIALLAPEVRNEGVIGATLGTALLAAGDKVTLNLANGSLLGYSIDQGAIDALAENRHLIQANGGQVLLSARAADRLTTATVNNTGLIEAKTLQNKSGRIMLMGDMEYGQVNVAGKLDASAPNTDGLGGNGGFIETSAARVKVAEGTVVTTLAAADGGGKSGRWLIDPVGYTIAASGGDISGSTITSNLTMGDVEVQSTSGDIHVNDSVTWNANKFTMSAKDNININASLYGSGTAKLALQYGLSSANGADFNYYVNNGAKVFLPGGFNFSTRAGTDGETLVYKVITKLGDAGSSTPGDLQGISGDLSRRYVLGADIDASATSSWNGGEGFAPLGTDSKPFSGQFDGLGHSISNLVINRPLTDNVGLFGYVQYGSTIRNVNLMSGSVTGGESTGSLVGSNYGKVEKTSSTADVRGGEYTGGLVGYNDPEAFILFSSAGGSVQGTEAVGGLVGHNYGVVVNSHATGDVTGTENYTGGLVGENAGAISGSYATGAVSGADYTGGLVGFNAYNGAVFSSYANSKVLGLLKTGGLVGRNDGYVSSSYASGNVEGSEFVGGLVGYNNGIISDAYATGDVYANVDYAGGLAGYNQAATINNAYASGFVKTAGTVAGGLVSQDYGTVTNSYWDTQTTGQAIDGSTGAVGLTTAQMMNAASFAGFNFCACSGQWWISEGNTRPFLRSEYSTTITNGHQLQLMALDLSAKYTLANDIDMSELGRASGMWNKATGFVPIGDRASNPFVGGLEGAGYTINNLVINRPTTDYVGLFSYTGSGSNIRNVGLVGAQITGQRYTGALVGLNDYGNISGSYSAKDEAGVGSVTGTVAVGGLVGFNRGSIDTSYSDVSVSGTTVLGGLVGQNEGSISDAYASGSVAATSSSAGGLVGKNSGNISRTYATGAVTGTGTLGGLVGKHEVGSGAIINSYWDKDKTGQASSSGSAKSSGKTTGEMKQLATFAGFDMDDAGGTGKVWRIYEGNTGPLLRKFLKGITVADVKTTYNGSGQFGNEVLPSGGRSGVIASGRNAGSYSAYSGQQGYDIKGGKLEIGRAKLTLTAQDDARDYNGTDSSNGVVAVSGLLLGSDSVNASQRFDNKHAGNQSLKVQYKLDDGNGGGNYDVTTKNAKGHINRAKLTVTADKVVKDYDGTTASGDAAKVGILAGAGAGETAAGAKIVFTRNSASVDNKTVKVSGLQIKDALGADVTGDYLITYVGNSISTINKRVLNVTSTADNKTYDGTTAATVKLGDDRVLGDDLKITANASFTDKNAGLNKTVNVALGKLSGTKANNYVLASNAGSATADIAQRDIDVSVTGNNKTYDGTTDATVIFTDKRIGNDILTVTGNASFSDKNAGSNKTVEVKGISLTGTDAGNYKLTNTSKSTIASIARRSLNVASTGVNKTYDGTTAATVNLIDNRVGIDNLNITGSAVFKDKNAGQNKDVLVSNITMTGSDANNYVLVNKTDTTTASIAQRALNVTATGIDKKFDGTTAATVNYGDNRVAGDILNVTGTANFVDKNIASRTVLTSTETVVKDGNNSSTVITIGATTTYLNKQVNVTNIGLTGTDAGNYVANTTAVTSAKITP